ncbi:unnamed protein product [Cyprideis torosa]|uniref:Uncharacterized protein n=1 Tax=Cyprideis torosa TaxID=163714 RepID=A0A7R8WNH7_9CRUS|nr:unnamed protein product [Cyprideis torosa]CAG0904060.1 unnamed protein product [Cyprideis torosa]
MSQGRVTGPDLRQFRFVRAPSENSNTPPETPQSYQENNMHSLSSDSDVPISPIITNGLQQAHSSVNESPGIGVVKRKAAQLPPESDSDGDENPIRRPSKVARNLALVSSDEETQSSKSLPGAGSQVKFPVATVLSSAVSPSLLVKPPQLIQQSQARPKAASLLSAKVYPSSRVTKKTQKRAKTSQGRDVGADSASDDDEDYANESKVYDSDEEDSDRVYEETTDRSTVLKLFQTATLQELSAMHGCSKKKAEAIIALRPFHNWRDLLLKFQSEKHVSPDLLNSAQQVLDTRESVRKLMERCKKISEKMTKTISGQVEALTAANGKTNLFRQPKMIPSGYTMKPYQLTGLQWLILMLKNNLNAILADEMGLGKTIQAISLLCHLKEVKNQGKHLIIVPSSTLGKRANHVVNNWIREIETWAPNLNIVVYHGSIETRRHIRISMISENNPLDFDILITTYTVSVSTLEDRVLFKKYPFNVLILDEAHMIKNFRSQRYESLSRIKATHRILLTGTPLQNNLIELMSLLIFIMPNMFQKKREHLNMAFKMIPTNQNEKKGKKSVDAEDEVDCSENSGNQKNLTASEITKQFLNEQIAQAQLIMRPFVLRRVKKDVEGELPLPEKVEEVVKVPMAKAQQTLYDNILREYRRRMDERADNPDAAPVRGISTLMELRKAANHPLLLRTKFRDDMLDGIARKMCQYDRKLDHTYVMDDLKAMSDFQIHMSLKRFGNLTHLKLDNSTICDSGKLNHLDVALAMAKHKGDRVLLFSQFKIVLDLIQEYLRIRQWKSLRLDGETPVAERLSLIDQFNRDNSVLVFLLSTRAGGVGINLTGANTVVIHDPDFNPYNDKQAEDRCHRLGQTRAVRVVRLVSEDTVEESIAEIANQKLLLGREIQKEGNGQEEVDVKKVLEKALKKKV